MYAFLYVFAPLVFVHYGDWADITAVIVWPIGVSYIAGRIRYPLGPVTPYVSREVFPLISITGDQPWDCDGWLRIIMDGYGLTQSMTEEDELQCNIISFRFFTFTYTLSLHHCITSSIKQLILSLAVEIYCMRSTWTSLSPLTKPLQAKWIREIVGNFINVVKPALTLCQGTDSI